MSDLKEQWQQKKASGTRIRVAAKELGSSEGALLETELGHGVVRLKPDFDGILTDLANLGPVKAITRNDSCVHEKIGDYLGFKRAHGPIAILNNPEIDLRLFLNHWSRAYNVESARGNSWQFFDDEGAAVHKVYEIAESNSEASGALLEKFRAESQSAEDFQEASKASSPEMPDRFDKEAFLAAWSELKDTHDFHMMQRKFKLSRTQALEAGEGVFTRRVGQGSARKIIEWAAESGDSIMVFVGNPGCIQIHTGPIQKVADARGWFNILDDGFNLHLKEEEIANTWVVRKPTNDGDVTSLELFAEDDTPIAQFFGARKPGQPELESWRTTLEENIV